ncbi:hypothetical protein ACH5RR_029001 [Cinchona calisaya]|uniref:F-box domain-containing protein n=1 Tax=Cinchona calisaya TaxID=153742 RepID=A0ABD2YQE5_9GENT
MPTTMDDLPEELIRHILSFFPTIDVMKFSFLSPKWLNLWHSLPTLNFQISASKTSLPAKFAVNSRNSSLASSASSRGLRVLAHSAYYLTTLISTGTRSTSIPGFPTPSIRASASSIWTSMSTF